MKKIFIYITFILSFSLIFSDIQRSENSIDVSNVLENYIYFDTTDNNRSLIRATDYNLLETSSGDYYIPNEIEYKKNYQFSIFNWLDDDKCIITKTENLIQANWKLSGANEKIIQDLKNNLTTPYISEDVFSTGQNILNNNLWMNISAEIKYKNGAEIIETFLLNDIGLDISNPIFNNYRFINITPIDLKCNFNGLINGKLKLIDRNSIQIINEDFQDILDELGRDNIEKIKNDTLKVNPSVIYDPISNKTIIKANLSKLGLDSSNVSIYIVINKSGEYVNSLNKTQINYFRSLYPNEFFVVDKDPIIGYHFDNLPENEIEINISGNVDLDVLIEEEAIVYSGAKDYIFNYRDSYESCDQITLINNGKHICINFLNNSLKGTNQVLIKNEYGTETLKINGSNINISLNNGYKANFKKNFYNPENGKWSCLGIENGNELNRCDSEMGDNNYRIWIKIEKVEIENIAEIEVIELTGNSANIKFLNISSYNSLTTNISYCVVDYLVNTCNGNFNSLKFGEDITINCPVGENGCIRKIIYRVNNSGVLSEEESYPLTLLKPGSACYSSCVANPFPNLLLKNCNGINNCKFYEDSETSGADKCNYQSPNARVDFNVSNDLICPNKLTTEKRYTKKSKEKYIEEKYKNKCDNLILKSIPIKVDNTEAKMVFVFCE